MAAGLRPDTLGELERSPRTPSRKTRGLLLRGGEGREGDRMEGKKTGGEGEWGRKKGREEKRVRKGEGEGRGGKGGRCPP